MPRARVRVTAAAVLCSLLTAAATAQTPVASPPGPTRLAWDHDGLNVDSWRLAVDNVDGTFVPTGPTSEAPYWWTPFPALTPGLHTLKVGACNLAGCSYSEPFDVRVVVVPNKPVELRIVVPPNDMQR